MGLIVGDVLLIAVVVRMLSRLIPHQLQAHDDGGRLTIRRSRQARLVDSVSFSVWALLALMLVVTLGVGRSWLGVGLAAALLAFLAWAWHREVACMTVLDCQEDRVTHGARIVAVASDIVGVEVQPNQRQPVLLMLQRGTGPYRGWGVPDVDRSAAEQVGPAIADYLGVPLVMPGGSASPQYRIRSDYGH
ncbi:MAG: hypothetical protein HW416_3335 [Chloroflexi bacterium]|nr:hypothetical protein [Chloroflexota bacterium]